LEQFGPAMITNTLHFRRGAPARGRPLCIADRSDGRSDGRPLVRGAVRSSRRRRAEFHCVLRASQRLGLGHSPWKPIQ
jgi:hypothetical protein